MLLVKTKLGISKIPNAGIGLFADDYIKKGTIVWKLNTQFDRLISMSEFYNLDEITQKFISTYGYTRKDYPFIIFCFDNARFINHSFDGNLTPSTEVFGNMHISIASKDIYQEEELTENYAVFDDKSLKKEDYY